MEICKNVGHPFRVIWYDRVTNLFKSATYGEHGWALAAAMSKAKDGHRGVCVYRRDRFKRRG